MSYFVTLDEHDERSLVGELVGRARHRAAGRCDYCERPWGVERPCKFPDRHEGRYPRQPLVHVLKERALQDLKWGQQDHPDGTGEDGRLLRSIDQPTYATLAWLQRDHVDRMAAQTGPTYLEILLEEVFEAAAEPDPVLLRRELVQVAAVAMAWVEAIDRRSAEVPA